MNQTPSEAGKPARIIARFPDQRLFGDTPQDQADVTERVLALSVDQLHQLRDDSSQASLLVNPRDGDRCGPDSVKIEAAICAYFGVRRLEDVSQANLDTSGQQAGVEKAKRAGYQVHQGTTIDGPDLEGRWWWTFGAMGSASYETSRDEYDTETEAWSNAIIDMDAHEATYLFPNLAEADKAEAALIEEGFDVHRSVTCHCTLLSISGSDEQAKSICTANNGVPHDGEDEDEASGQDEGAPLRA
jgi:hypothetical protein